MKTNVNGNEVEELLEFIRRPWRFPQIIRVEVKQYFYIYVSIGFKASREKPQDFVNRNKRKKDPIYFTSSPGKVGALISGMEATAFALIKNHILNCLAISLFSVPMNTSSSLLKRLKPPSHQALYVSTPRAHTASKPFEGHRH